MYFITWNCNFLLHQVSWKKIIFSRLSHNLEIHSFSSIPIQNALIHKNAILKNV